MEIETLVRLSKDLKDASRNIGRQEARFLVDTYYQIQKLRLATGGQIRSAGEEEPYRVLAWVNDNAETIENDIKKALNAFTKRWTAGIWLQSITGIGPVIAAGMMAHLEITKAPTCCHFWAYAGLDPSTKWLKGEKRPWNADLKVLCWKTGESFVKSQNSENDFYGKIYVSWKEIYTKRNEDGEYAATAAQTLSEKKYSKDTDAYKAYSEGRLPKAHIHSRATRKAVKMFLSHLHHVMFEDFYGKKPPVPYIFTEKGNQTGHTHYLAPPNWPMVKSGSPLFQFSIR